MCNSAWVRENLTKGNTTGSPKTPTVRVCSVSGVCGVTGVCSVPSVSSISGDTYFNAAGDCGELWVSFELSESYRQWYRACQCDGCYWCTVLQICDFLIVTLCAYAQQG